MIRVLYCLLAIVVIAGLLAACAAPAPTAVPTTPAKAPVAPAATAAVSAPTAAPVAATKPSAAPTSAAAAAPTATPGPKVKRGGTLRVGLQNDWMGFDPPITQGVWASSNMIFDGLIRWRPDQKGVWGPAPGLASEWELKGTEGTFKLRKGVKFHDGSEFNAQVAKWNFDRMLKDPKSRVKSLLAEVDRVDVVDPYTIKFAMKMPIALLPAILTTGGTFQSSKDAFEKMGAEAFNRSPVGSGAHRFVEWKDANQVTVKRFESYWEMGADGQPLPYLDGITYRLLTDDTVRFLDLKAGNLDFTDRLAGKDVPGLKASPDLVYVEAAWGSQSYRLGFNLEKGPFTNKSLRKAVAYAIDRDSIAKVLGVNGTGVPAKYHILPGVVGYDESVPAYSFSPDKAKAALAEGGLASGTDVTLITHNRPLDARQSEMLKQMFDAVGIRTTIGMGERAANVAKREAGEFEFTSLVHSAAVDPDLNLTTNLACGQVGNWVRYCNKDFDKVLTDARGFYDPKQRHEAYKKAQTILYEDVPDNFFWSLPYIYGYNKKVQGFVPSWTEYFELRGVWLQ